LKALDGVSLDVAPGEVVGVIGPNGAGKTTLFDCLSGLQPCLGTVVVGGVDVSGWPTHRRAAAGLGRSFQDARLFPSLTVADTIRAAFELHHADRAVGAAALGLPRLRRAEAEAAARADEVMGMLGLRPHRHKLIKELSTGTRRIVDLACLLVQEPAVVLLDEPSSGIAQREAEALGPLLLEVRDRTGAAMVVIEHDMPLLLGIAERLYALELGRVIAQGSPGSVVRHPEVVRSYLGDDPAAIGRSGELGSTSAGASGEMAAVGKGAQQWT
jgi:branched-chain amino acid transport system ATP-binding protein